MYFFSVGGIFKNESHSIREWIDHYIAQGADHFYLINDNSTDDFRSKISDLIEKGIVTIYDAICDYYHGRQRDLYNKYLLPIVDKKETKWLLIADLDEYSWTPNHSSIAEFLKGCSNAQIQFNHTLYGSNGHISQPKSVVAGFTRRSKDQPHKGEIIKYFVNSDYKFTSFNVHHASFEDEQHNLHPYFIRVGSEYIIMNHYCCQSREFWKDVKCTRGDGDGYLTRNMDIFESLDFNEIDDKSLLDLHIRQGLIKDETIDRRNIKTFTISHAFYGLGDFVDVTSKIYSRWKKYRLPVFIGPNDEARFSIFGVDPTPYYVKMMLLNVVDESGKITVVPISEGTSMFLDFPPSTTIKDIVSYGGEVTEDQLLGYFHKTLKLEGGPWTQELPEQKLIFSELKGDETVLEIGGNIGRSSMIIASCLRNEANLVTLDCHQEYFKILTRNRDANGFKFNLVNKALSLTPLVMSGWATKPGFPSGDWKAIELTNFRDLQKLVLKPFDTMVIDCEGAFVNILKDFPTILEGISLVIIENDFKDDGDLKYVTSMFELYGLKCKKSIPLPYFSTDFSLLSQRRFYEVWSKK